MENATDMIEDYERTPLDTTYLPERLLPATVTPLKGPPVNSSWQEICGRHSSAYQSSVTSACLAIQADRPAKACRRFSAIEAACPAKAHRYRCYGEAFRSRRIQSTRAAVPERPPLRTHALLASRRIGILSQADILRTLGQCLILLILADCYGLLLREESFHRQKPFRRRAFLPRLSVLYIADVHSLNKRHPLPPDDRHNNL